MARVLVKVNGKRSIDRFISSLHASLLCLLTPVERRGDTGKLVDQTSAGSTGVIKSFLK